MDEIRNMGEDSLIDKLLEQVPAAALGTGAAGAGDDCAVIEADGDVQQLLKTDAMVEGRHWDPDTEASRVGWKAVARVISDIAAMGGRPEEFLVTLALPGSVSVDWATGLYRGMGKCLEAFGARMVGGETTRCPEGAPVVISIAARGVVNREQVTLRSEGKAGDLLLVTGKLGGSLEERHLDFLPRVEEADWLTRQFKPTAMMDLSDGLAADLPRLARASGCGAKLDHSALPLHANCSIEQALNDGEDYELLFAIDADSVAPLRESWAKRFPETALSVIGSLCEIEEGDTLSGGWDHFRKD
ncbi:MAG: thiamine-phosphate kinase [Akkermansiaceae bacterium]|nr:thiamine-phosphate kinase [Akkermansiaceae bacterium]